MDTIQKIFISVGALSGAISVLAGAFGAHGLESQITAERLDTFHTAARYQMYHSIALLLTAWAISAMNSGLPKISGWLFIAGIFLFSGSLYLLVLTDTPWLGAVTPLGGLAFIAGWILLAISPFKG